MYLLSQINFSAIATSSIVIWVLYFLWYGPFFGKSWTKSKNDSKEALVISNFQTKIVASLLYGLILSYTLSHFVIYFHSVDLGSAIQLGFWVWLAFAGSAQFLEFISGGKKKDQMVIDSGFYLISFVLAAIILSLWGLPLK